MEKSYEECMKVYEEAIKRALKEEVVECGYQGDINGLDNTLVMIVDGESREFLALLPGNVKLEDLEKQLLS